MFITPKFICCVFIASGYYFDMLCMEARYIYARSIWTAVPRLGELIFEVEPLFGTFKAAEWASLPLKP